MQTTLPVTESLDLEKVQLLEHNRFRQVLWVERKVCVLHDEGVNVWVEFTCRRERLETLKQPLV